MIIRKPFIPRPWQPHAIQHIIDTPRCALWAGMGLGKTSITLTALEMLNYSEGDVYPALAIGPLRVARKVWREEVQKWDHLKDVSVSQIIGDADTRGFVVDRLCHPGNNALHQIYTINYENIAWLEEKLAGRMPFKTIIADEARKLHRFRLKQGGVMTAALGRMAWHPNIRRFIEPTGTPSPNGLKDLWGQAWFLDQGKRLGTSYDAFETRWFAYKRIKDALTHKPGIQAVIQKGADTEIHKLMEDLCLSINLRDWIDIAEPIQSTIKVELPINARKLYKEMERTFYTEVESHAIEAFSAAGKSIKLLQFANGAVYLDPTAEDDSKSRPWKEVHKAKLEALDSIIEEAEGMPILVVYHFKSDLARLQAAYPAPIGRHIHSEQDEDDFKAGKIQVAFVHPKSIGHGVDGFEKVTNIIAFFGHWWDLELRMQIIERIGPTRQMQSGLDRPVFVYDIVAEDSIDEVVLARHETKRDVQDLLMEAAKRVLGK